MKKNEIDEILRSVRMVGGCREDSADLRRALGDRWGEFRHELRQIAMGLADDHTVGAIEHALNL